MKASYHFTVNPVKQTITLRPTKGTYAKAFLPSIVLFVAANVMFAVADYKEKQESKKDTRPSTI